jgi:aflatoxin B1 aldehyde reductase
MYNAITRSCEAELIPTLRRYGMDMVIYNPLAGGLLSGKIKSQDVPTDGRFSTNAGPQGAHYRQRYFRDAVFDGLKAIEDAISHHNLTMVEVALRWCVHHSQLKLANKGGNDGVIIGVSSFNQLESNLDDLEKGPLPEEVVKALDEAWKLVKADTPNYWHGDLKYNYDTVEALFGKNAK